MVDTTELVKEVTTDLIRKLKEEGEEVTVSGISLLVKKVVKEVIQRRNYPDSMNDETILKDLENHYATIISVSEYDYNMIGAEGEELHTENGVSRRYVDRNKLFGNVFPYVRYLV